MRALQMAAGVAFLANGLVVLTGGKDLVQRMCTLKSSFVPESCQSALRAFSEADPEVLFYWGLNNTIAGSLMLLTACADCCCKSD